MFLAVDIETRKRELVEGIKKLGGTGTTRPIRKQGFFFDIRTYDPNLSGIGIDLRWGRLQYYPSMYVVPPPMRRRSAGWLMFF